jgi:DNA polymerase-3 subunit chi
MQVDFYQLGGSPPEQVIARIAEKILARDGRLLIVAGEEPLLARLDRMLWDQGPTNFLPHGLAGGADDARQPILLSTSEDAPNLARNMLIADGQWREAALSYDRSFYLVRRRHPGRRPPGVEAARGQGRGRATLLGTGGRQVGQQGQGLGLSLALEGSRR